LESELVSGFMTEHAAVIFVFFFLAEYGSILLMCILTSIFFFGGYLYSLPNIIDLFEKVISIYFLFEYNIINIIENPFNEGLLYGLNLGIKSSILVFIFIWVRASFPRIRFDQLMSFCWTILLPILFGFIIFIPCILYSLNLLVINIALL
jgi:NADH-ubiquinone oxidoreductase chain 1